jgi:alcohol dehydrogenase class IV
MNKYNLSFPGKTIFGAGTLSSLSSELPDNSKIMLVVGKHVETSGLLNKVGKILESFEFTVFSGVQAEPPLSAVDEIISMGRLEQVSAVVAIGGGSVIDAAKAAAAIIPAEGQVGDYFYGHKSITEKGLFLAALPTTAGTGTEATPNSVLTDQKTEIKKSIRHITMFPDLAIIDPELTYSCSRSLTAHSGLDALTQAIESYISLGANTVSRALAAKAVELIFTALPRACENGKDIDARNKMAEGSMITALAFAQSSLGAVHGIGHPIGSKLHVPHGLCCAILLPVILRWNHESCREKLTELGKICGFTNSDEFIEGIENLCKILNIPDNFREFGLKNEIFPFILENCRSGSMRSNPRHFEDNEIVEILESLL